MNLVQVSLKSVTRRLAVIVLPLILFSGQVNAAVTIESSATGLEVSEETIKTGKEIFETKCASCHAIDRRMTGPALKGITERREIDWLVAWIKDNEALRKSGDEQAIAVYNEYNKMPMLPFPDLSDEEIKSVIMYVENGGWSDAPVQEAAAGGEATAEADPSLIKKVNWVLILIFVMIGIILIMSAKVLDMVSKITGRQVIKWNNVNATLMLLFLVAGFIGIIYETSIHGKYVLMGNAASEHGVEIDRMMWITLIITATVFVITQVLLFWFSFRYRKKEGVKALFYPDNDRLEIVWTLIPFVVLTVLVIGGLNAWNRIMDEPDPTSMEVEVFGFQFGWQARYPGADGTLGNTNYNLISQKNNPLGLANRERAEMLITDLEEDIKGYQAELDTLDLKLTRLQLSIGGLVGDKKKNLQSQIDFIESGSAQEELELQIRRRNTQIRRIKAALEANDFFTPASEDDIIVSELHVVVNKPVVVRLRGRDVIHSAFLKDFRTQMNVVPGIPTHFEFKPTITTKERRQQTGNNEFDYYLVCNKICGNSHYNMKMKVVVETQEEYNTWISSQNAYFAKQEADEAEETEPAPEQEDTETPATEESEEESTQVAINN